jgi:predicted DNA-binding transcriptional regulator AlpA
MPEFEFTLKFSLTGREGSIDELVERLGAAGCTDALVGIGQPGRIGLAFTREAHSATEAVQSALADVRGAIPSAKLVEAAPDFVGLTDIAQLLGCSRQNMRKLAVQANGGFPPPIHEGTPTIWHLATVLDWLQSRGNQEIEGRLRDVARINRQINLARELHDLDVQPASAQDLRRLLVA